MNIVKTVDLTKTYNSGVEVHALSNVNFELANLHYFIYLQE